MRTSSLPKISRSERQEWGLFSLLVGPNLFLFIVFTFWPLIYNFYLSLNQWDMLSPVIMWRGLDNYFMLFSSADFGHIVSNTFLFTIASVVLTTLLGLGGALLLNQPLKGRDTVRAILFSPTVLSGAAIGIVWVYIFDPRFGLIESFLHLAGGSSPAWLTDPKWAMAAVIIVYVWKHLGYSMVILLAGLKVIPKELYEAARVDGAGNWARFWEITLPGLSPVMFFLLLTSTLSSFQAFDLIKTMTNGGPVNATNTLIYYMYEQGFIAFNSGNAGVAATLLFGIMLAFTIIQTRYTERNVHYA